MKYKYRVDDGDFYNFSSKLEPPDARFIVVDMAEDYHSFHDGWEEHWPLLFTVADESENIIGKFEVDRETIPQFIASEIKDSK